MQQDYDVYTPANHEAWRRLYAGMCPLWQRYATPQFLNGLENLHLDPSRVPRLDDVNRFLASRTGFKAVAVPGYVSAPDFFDHLRRREFPTTITVRPLEKLDYLPEPDIFHDVAGHVPMHTDPVFAASLARFGECAHAAADLQALARFFWFTVEFGLIRCGTELKAYGSGLMSSRGELPHALESPAVERRRFSVEEVIRQSFEIDHYQPVLFVIEGFDELYESIGELEDRVQALSRSMLIHSARLNENAVHRTGAGCDLP